MPASDLSKDRRFAPSNPPRRLVIGISGASGTVYGVRMLELLHGTGIETHLVMSKAAEMTLAYETDYKVKDVRALAGVNHPNSDIGATISSGSFPLRETPMLYSGHPSSRPPCHRLTTELSIPNRSSRRPTVWLMMSSTVWGRL